MLVLIAGCDAVAVVPDAAHIDDAPWGARGVVHVVLADENVPAGDVLDLAVLSMELTSDRDPGVEPIRTDIRALHVDAAGADVAFEGVAPGTYSAIELQLGGAAEALVATLDTPTQRFVVRMNAPLSLVARCQQGQSITVTGTLHVGLDFALDDVVVVLSRHPLPPAASGVISVDETSAPEALADFRATLATSIHAECTSAD